jgi:hypothetical protein
VSTEADTDATSEMFEYDVVPFVITRGAGGSESDLEWASLRAGLNRSGRLGFRVVAVTEGQEGRAVIMERQVGPADRGQLATAGSVSQAAEDITWDASREQR